MDLVLYINIIVISCHFAADMPFENIRNVIYSDSMGCRLTLLLWFWYYCISEILWYYFEPQAQKPSNAFSIWLFSCIVNSKATAVIQILATSTHLASYATRKPIAVRMLCANILYIKTIDSIWIGLLGCIPI